MFKSTSGSNTTVFTYPATGTTGRGADVKITSYTSGGSKWLPATSTVISGQEYTYSQNYKATVSTKLFASYTFNDGTTTVQLIDTLPAAANWTAYSKTIKMPVNLKSVAIYDELQSVGQLTIDDIYLDQIYIYMTSNDLKNLQAQGHEVSDHTKTHPHLPTLTPAQVQDEIIASRAVLTGLGITPVSTFVYPYGEFNDAVIQTVKDGGYIGARSVDEGYNLKNTDKYKLLIQQANNTTTLANFQGWVDKARADKTWLIVMYHQVENGSTDSLAITPDLMQQMANYLVSSGTSVVTMAQGINMMGQ